MRGKCLLHMKHDAIIFDLFGTLVDDLVYPEPNGVSYREMMRRVANSLSANPDDFRRVWSRGADDRNRGEPSTMAETFAGICRELGIVPSPHQLDEAVHIRLQHFQEAMTPREDTLDTLAKLRSGGYKIGLISDCTAEVPILWPDCPISPLMDTSILSCDVGMKKPEPGIYQLVCDKLKVSPGRCIYVGDGGSQELTGASELGMEAIQIRASYDNVSGTRQDWDGTKIAELGEMLTFV